MARSEHPERRDWTRRALLTRGVLWAGLTPTLSGCAAGGGAGSQARVPSENVQISFATDWNSGARLETVKQALAIWQGKNPHVAVDLRTEGGSVETKIVSEFAAGTQADVVLFTSTGIAALRQHFADL